MRIITINLPQSYLNALQHLMDKNIIPSRSQGIRNALIDFLVSDLTFKRKLNDGTFKMTIRKRDR